jgi:hypothetical protein
MKKNPLRTQIIRGSYKSTVLLLLMVFLPGFLGAQEVLRGRVWVDLEPVYQRFVDVPYPLDTVTAQKRALEETKFYFEGMLYGWSFDYEVGERARKIEENFELHSLGSILWGDPRLTVTDGSVEGTRFYLWTEYRPDDSQRGRLKVWDGGQVQKTQGNGTGPLAGPVESSQWMDGKKEALQDAARAAVRAFLRGTERNRPKEAHGLIALSEFPLYRIEMGRWVATAQFRLDLRELVPFAAY